MVDPDKLAYAKRYLARTRNLGQLKELADQVARALLSGETRVTITMQTFEGGQTQAAVEFEAVIVGTACEDLIAAWDPTAKPPPSQPLGSIVLFA